MADENDTMPEVDEVETFPVTIVKGFTYTHSGTRHQQYFAPGVHQMDSIMAKDHYILSHSDNPPPPIIAPGTPAYAHMQAAAMRRRKMIEEVVEYEAVQAAQKIRTDARVSGKIAQDVETAHEEALDQEMEQREVEATNEAARQGLKPPVRGSFARRTRPAMTETEE